MKLESARRLRQDRIWAATPLLLVVVVTVVDCLSCCSGSAVTTAPDEDGDVGVSVTLPEREEAGSLLVFGIVTAAEASVAEGGSPGTVVLGRTVCVWYQLDHAAGSMRAARCRRNGR